MNYHPKHKSNSRTAVWIGAGVLAAVAIGAIIFIIVTLRSPMTKEEARAKAGIVYDSSATEGGWDNLSPEEIEARLDTEYFSIYSLMSIRTILFSSSNRL